jgi:single-strand DNA-binding protein
MARTLNRVQLIGRLGGDPEMRITTSGMAVTTFSLATDRQWQDREGNMREETDWHTVVAWDRLGQICNEHLTKGRLVFVEGRLRYRSWESNGQKFYKTEVVASDMLILDPKGVTSVPEPAGAHAPQSAAQRPAVTVSRKAPTSTVAVLDGDEDPEDLPF